MTFEANSSAGDPGSGPPVGPVDRYGWLKQPLSTEPPCLDINLTALALHCNLEWAQADIHMPVSRSQHNYLLQARHISWEQISFLDMVGFKLVVLNELAPFSPLGLLVMPKCFIVCTI